MSDLPTMKKSVRRKKAGSTPIPKGPGSNPTCGHDGNCSTHACMVTYAGPVSRIHDHHMIRAAHGTTHIWPAAVISALALLITGSVAFSSVEAAQDQRVTALQKQSATRADIDKLAQQLNRIERIVTETRDSAGISAPTPRDMMDTMNGLPAANDR